MKMNVARWIICSAACMSVGCSGLERHIRSSEQATVYASPSLQSDAVSQKSKTGINTPLEQDHALRTQPVSQAAYAHQSSQAAGVVEPASVDVVMVDPVASTEAIADGATLEELLSLAFANNPAIKELAATTQIAAGYRTQVGLYANPMLGYQGQQLADAGTDQHLLFVQQQIITGDKRALNRAVLNEAVRAQVQELEAQKLRVATDIKTAYYDSLRIQEQLASIDQFFELLKQGVNAAEKRMQAGEGSKIDLLQTQVQVKQLELDRRQLSASLSARLREIVALAGMPNMQLQAVAGELPKLPASQDWKAVEDGLVATSPEYAAAQARIRQASAAIRRQESQPLPNLNVQFGAGVDNSTDSGMMNVQVGAPIPVFNKNQGNIAAARAEYCRAVQEAQRIDNAIRARLAIASGDYARAAEAVDMYLSELLPAAQETLDLAEGAYRAGEQDFIQLLVTRRTYFDTNLAYIAARAQLATAQAQIDGYMLTGALNAVINNSGDDSLRGLTLDQE
ncbi:Cobalt-zinc-cadmium resistance protein CzcC precursor [Pirellula sp. SH-Sr6A]|jgi:cobalt-zinc-cadmium efflux system outer membrane protein|uniref:TolC family protein n=1 Tax=Pirellula sp. SH-Sr6A TaxID=1632865 RepID=UPI00078B55CD|nr:TolC family protein [Pirellula sp. SH-Sr6A]AMV31612.1 Cobalt-zinc-cadmium resistance protein CzcC precursor [Pirellula sp. SH-Sr6A]